MELGDAEVIQSVLEGRTEEFERIIVKYQPRIFAMARRYARRESEVADIVQEVFIKASQKLSSYRGEAPFEHWLMRLSVRTCYDFLRGHQRSRETPFADMTPREEEWLVKTCAEPSIDTHSVDAARQLVQKILEQMPPAARLVITLLELEDRSAKEIAALTGWSVPLVKVKAFRARAQMRKILRRMTKGKYL